MSDGSAADLLAMAEAVMTRATPSTAGLWPRAAALLARQALETALDDYWQTRGLALGRCGTRQQLICLREYLPSEEAAGRVYEAWATLTRACHHQPYELAPTVAELGALLTTVRGLLPALPGQQPPGGPGSS